MKPVVKQILTVGLAIETLLQSGATLPPEENSAHPLSIVQSTGNSQRPLSIVPLVLAPSPQSESLIARGGGHSSHSSHSSHYSGSSGHSSHSSHSSHYSGSSTDPSYSLPPRDPTPMLPSDVPSSNRDPFSPPEVTPADADNATPLESPTPTSHASSSTPASSQTRIAVDVKVNGKLIEKSGLLVNGQPYVRVDVLETLTAENQFFQQVAMYVFQRAGSLGIPTLQHERTNYVHAYEIQQLDYDLSTSWNSKRQMIVLQSRSQGQ